MGSCTYLDTTTHTHTELGELYARSFVELPASSASGVLLRTCHRLEWYEAAQDDEAAVPFLPAARTVRGHQVVLTRLAQIAAGTRSLIAGERFVFDQVRTTFSGLPDAHALRHAAVGALSVASEARRRFGLVARLDYTDLARLLLQRERRTTPRTLVIVGGGVLARALATEFGDSRAVLMVTRQPKRLRRHLTRSGISATALRAADLAAHLDGYPYDAVLATSGLDAEYKAHIAALSVADACRTTVDLCMVPTLDDGPAYHHLHDPEVIKTIEDANQDVAARASDAEAWIEGIILGQ